MSKEMHCPFEVILTIKKLKIYSLQNKYTHAILIKNNLNKEEFKND